MSFEGLPKEVVSQLLAKGKRSRATMNLEVVKECTHCGKTLQQGYCFTSNCPSNPYKDVEGHECENCGWCENPGKCVWSVACPVCGAGIGLQCRQDHRVVGLHVERHEACIFLLNT